MGRQKVKTKRGSTCLINRLDKFEWLSQEELKVLVNRVVPQLLPVCLEQKGQRIILSVTLDNLVPLAEYMSQPLEMGTILTFIWRTVKIAMECERHGLRIESLCWDARRIFVEQQRGEICMVYWPAINLEQNGHGILQFYAYFMNLMRQYGMLPEIYDQYAAYFYQRSHFDLHGFYQMMDSVILYWKKHQKEKKNPETNYSGSFGKHQTEKFSISCYLEKGSEQLVLQEETTTFGRDKAMCDIVITSDVFVSRRHAKIDRDGERFFLTDLGSANGTFINNKRLKAGVKVELFEGVKVCFGSTSYVFHIVKSTSTVFIHC